MGLHTNQLSETPIYTTTQKSNIFRPLYKASVQVLLLESSNNTNRFAFEMKDVTDYNELAVRICKDVMPFIRLDFVSASIEFQEYTIFPKGGLGKRIVKNKLTAIIRIDGYGKFYLKSRGLSQQEAFGRLVACLINNVILREGYKAAAEK